MGNPNQPRVPAGGPAGGEWTSGGTAGSPHVSSLGSGTIRPTSLQAERASSSKFQGMGIHGHQPSSVDKEAAQRMVEDWTIRATLHGADAPSDSAILGTKDMVPKGPVTVYRAGHADPAQEALREATAWTRSKGIAESLIEDGEEGRVLYTRTVQPHEVLFDTSVIRTMKDGGWLGGGHDYDEVVVVKGALKERVNAIRGDHVTTGSVASTSPAPSGGASKSSWSPDPHSAYPVGTQKAMSAVADAKAGHSVARIAEKHGYEIPKLRALLKTRGVRIKE